MKLFDKNDRLFIRNDTKFKKLTQLSFFDFELENSSNSTN